MNDAEAKKIARRFLSECIELKYCSEPPGPVYNFHPSKDILFSFHLFESPSVNKSKTQG